MIVNLAQINIIFAIFIIVIALILYAPLFVISLGFVIKELIHYIHWKENHFQVTVYSNPEHKTTQISLSFDTQQKTSDSILRKKIKCNIDNDVS